MQSLDECSEKVDAIAGSLEGTAVSWKDVDRAVNGIGANMASLTRHIESNLLLYRAAAASAAGRIDHLSQALDKVLDKILDMDTENYAQMTRKMSYIDTLASSQKRLSLIRSTIK